MVIQLMFLKIKCFLLVVEAIKLRPMICDLHRTVLIDHKILSVMVLLDEKIMELLFLKTRFELSVVWIKIITEAMTYDTLIKNLNILS